MRFCCVLEDDQPALFRFASAAFDAYFRQQRNLDDVAVLVEIADACGLDGAGLARRIQDEDVKQHLRANTQEVIDRGGFGSPTIVVDEEDLYFGNDQLPLVRQALMRAAAAAEALPRSAPST
jgi:2-hydroxychromene-2-carboxylate isomerase